MHGTIQRRGGYLDKVGRIGRLCCAMLFCTLCVMGSPTVARAANYGNALPDLGIGGSKKGDYQFDDGTYYKIAQNGKSVQESTEDDWNILYKDKILYLNDAVIADTLYIPGGTKLVVTGQCSVSASTAIQIQTAGAVSIDLQGDLSLNGGSYECITDANSKASVAISSSTKGSLTTRKGSGIVCTDDITISGDAQVLHDTEAGDSASGSALSTDGNIVISGTACVELEDKVSAGGTITVSDQASLSVSSNLSTSNYSIPVKATSALISDNASFRVEGVGYMNINGGLKLSGSPSLYVSLSRLALQNNVYEFEFTTDVVAQACYTQDDADLVQRTLDQLKNSSYKTVQIKPTSSHAWASAWVSDDSYHWHECQNSYCTVTDNSQKDGYAQHQYHDYVSNGDATCTADGTEMATCVCGSTDTRTAVGSMLSHAYGSWQMAVAATCSQTGTEERVCAD